MAVHRPTFGKDVPLREKIYSIYTELRTERASWVETWRENAELVSPTRIRLSKTNTNKGERKNRKIVDGKATRAHRTAVAGMNAGITPASRPWFVFSHPNRVLRELPQVRDWLYFAAAECRSILSKTNFYQAMPTFYGDLLTFSNGCLLIEDDKESIRRYTVIPIGEYAVANDHRGMVKTFMREFRLTVRQVVEKFCTKNPDGTWDLSNVSEGVRTAWKNSNHHEWVDIIHTICPNDGYDKNKIGVPGKKYLSVYWEYSLSNKRHYGDYGASNGEGFLRVSGYDRFPVLVGRWALNAGDAYGSFGPAQVAVGDIAELQYFARAQAESAYLQMRPPLVGSSRLNKQKGRMPQTDTITWLSDPKSSDSLRRIFDFNFDLRHVNELRAQLHQSISEAFYEDMFRRFTSDRRQHMTAAQVAEESQEKLIELNPMMELLNNDVLEPGIEDLFAAALERKLLPPPPEELQGQDIDVEYTSILHQAQKLLDAGGIERLVGFVGSIAGVAPKALNKINPYALVDTYAEIVSAPPGVVVSDEEAQKIEQAQAEATQRQQELDDAAVEAEALKNAGQAKINAEGQTALGAIAEAGAVGG